MKRVKDGEAIKELTKDDVFRGKEKIQKIMDKANSEIEPRLMENWRNWESDFGRPSEAGTHAPKLS